MAEDRRYFVGERVMVSRARDGEDHEEATLVDFHELLIEGDKLASVVVDFDDGERLYLTAREPNVTSIDPGESEDEDDWNEDEDELEEDEKIDELDADRAFRGAPDQVDDEEE